MLELKDIRKCYGKKEVLHNVNLSFGTGIYGLMGQNGAGKSTLMNIMADVLEPTSGSVLYEGTDITRLKDEYRKNIGFLPQDVGYYGNFTAEKTVRYFGVLRGVAEAGLKERAEEVLKSVNLYQNRNDKVRTFSGGMKQRLGIALTYVADPEILIFDEPTVGLDPEERERFKSLLKELSKNKTIILSTHIVSDVEDIADYAVVMQDGNIVRCDEVNGKDKIRWNI